ncbi:MarR family winged helix-turn-helix transcriptional regulator [Streptacidiphilus rugosus]|uniref:MarR family winged helix-turn-helix transcriptional regulator n=1 Tax=Streptacidiphilus rugosus TaxID=405783 RepID=UPI000562798A|nr:MarR family transcriptional regulator [Streptacidiphilus rugosus]
MSQHPAPPAAPVDLDQLQLDGLLCLAVHSTARAFDRVYRRLLEDLDLTYPQYLVMAALWRHGPLPVKRLGELLRLDYGTMSPLLKRLEAAGLVARRRDPRDERSVLVEPTAEGTRLKDRGREVPLRLARATGLTSQQAADLHAQLAHLTAALDASTA